MRKIGHDNTFLRQDIAFLLPLAVNAEAASILPDKETVPAFSIHLLHGSGHIHIFFGKNTDSVIHTPVIKKQPELT